MKRIRRSRAARMVSWLLTVAMITPLVTGVVAPVSAGAQTTAAPVGGVQTAIVLDFTSAEGGQLGKLLATQARDAVVVELMNSGRFDPLKQEDVVRTANELGLKAPYDQVARMHLAQQLGATVIVDGKVEFVKDLPGRQGVSVGLSIRVTEAQTGDLISGAAQIGESRSRPGITDRDSLAQEAVGNAATLGVRQILTYNLPEGTVIGQIGGDVITILVNKGARDGVTEGMEMIVTRGRERTGRIRITQVFNTDSEARVLENTLGIKPEDKVKAVFPMPEFGKFGVIKRPSNRTSSQNAVSTLGKVLLVVGMGLLIATAAKGSSTVTGVTAEPTLVNFGPAVRIQWRDNLFGQNALEYHIWRTPDDPFNYSGIPVAAISAGAQRIYFDLAAPFSFWNGVNQFIQPGFPNQNNNNNNNNGGGNTNRTLVTPAIGAITGFPIVGQTYIYSVSAVVEQTLNNTNNNNGGGGNNNNNGGGGNNLTTQDVESTPSPSGPATPLTMPIIDPGGTPANGATNVDIGQIRNGPGVTFSWPSVTGADLFQVEVSTDPSFKIRNMILIVGQFPSTAPLATGVLQSTLPRKFGPNGDGRDPILMKNPAFAAFMNSVPGAPSPTLYWRVGARNNGDQPGPVDWITGKSTVTDRTFRFIYSIPNSFRLAPFPPNQP